MKKLALLLASGALLACPLSQAASATANISVSLLPYIVSDLDTTDAYAPLAPDFANSKVGYSFSARDGALQGLSEYSPYGPAPLYTPTLSGPLSRNASYGPATVSVDTDGLQQLDVSAALNGLGSAQGSVGVYVPLIVNPHTSISFITRSTVDLMYNGNEAGRAYSSTIAYLRYATGRTVDSDSSYAHNLFGTGSWVYDELDSFTNNTDQPIALQYAFSIYSALSLAPDPVIPPPLPVPEPATYAMFAAGALVLLGARRRKSS